MREAHGTRPFRFSVIMLGLSTGEAWRRSCRRAEELGYDTLHIADHLGMPAPFSALATAAEVTERMRLGTLVLNAAFWNPALLAREVATCDQLTGGRLELGLGTGYIAAEHEAAGLPFGSPGARVDHLAHTVRELRRHLADPEHAPRPVQEPVPLLLGGNGDRVLRLAAEYAEVAAFTGARQVRGAPYGALELISPDALEERVSHFRACASSRSAPAELNMLVQRVAITEDRASAAASWRAHAPALTEPELLSHPALLAGTASEIAAQLHEHRERFGFTYYSVLEGEMEGMGAVMRELRGA
ncbi:TIGR03621 family F420-dependent LLM class oxidoreductase [Streptomyces sp. ODS28]|uniref:TIGR03621 family F420-dependent LLM class oxidoreductase n=1 Tax=Streptomyces sp. ODS28 TaxID=3136688 RepID=UPI0031EFD83E